MDKGQFIIEYENLKSKIDEVRLNIDFFKDDVNDVGYREVLSETERDSLLEQESLLDEAILLIRKAYWKLEDAQIEMRKLMIKGK